MSFWKPFRQPAQPKLKTEQQPFRYPKFFEPHMEGRHNATMGYNILYTVPPGKEYWITAVQGNAIAGAVQLRTGVVVLMPDGVNLYKRLAAIGISPTETGSYSVSYPMPMVIPENYIIVKWADAVHTMSFGNVFGWVGQTPEGTAYVF